MEYWEEMKTKTRLWWIKRFVVVAILVLAVIAFFFTAVYPVEPIYGYDANEINDDVEYVLPVTWQGSDDLKDCEMTGFVSIGYSHFGRRAVRVDAAISMKAKTEASASFIISHANNGRDQFCSFYDVKDNDLTDSFSVKLDDGDAESGKCVKLIIDCDKEIKNDYKAIISFQCVLSNVSINEALASFSWKISSADEGEGSIQISQDILDKYASETE